VASESIAGAYGVAARSGPQGASLISAANDAFIQAMHWAAVGSVIVGLLGVAVVFLWLPKRAPESVPVPEREPELVGSHQ